MHNTYTPAAAAAVYIHKCLRADMVEIIDTINDTHVVSANFHHQRPLLHPNAMNTRWLTTITFLIVVITLFQSSIPQRAQDVRDGNKRNDWSATGCERSENLCLSFAVYYVAN